MSYNDDILYNKNYLVIIDNSNKEYLKSIEYSFGNVIIFDEKKDLNNIIKFINNNNFRQLIFVDYNFEYENIINSIKHKKICKFLITYSLGGFSNDKTYSNFKSIIELYKNNKIQSLGFLDKNLFETLKNRNMNVFNVTLDLKNKQDGLGIKKTVGILSNENMPTHSFYNELCAMKLQGYTVKVLDASRETREFLKMFKISYINCKTKEELIKENIANIYVNFTDNNNLLFIESMDMKIPCVLGNNSILENGYLKNMLVVNSDDSIDEISRKLNDVIKNKSEILKHYENFRIRYSRNSKKQIKEFLEYESNRKSNADSKLLLSIVVPVYNTGPYLEKCLKSILRALPSSIKNKSEILIINDGSKDSSEQIILKYKNKYPKLINYIKQKNHGLGNVRNVALENVKGKYIASIDSDDTINRLFFREAIKYMNNNVDIIIYDWLSVTDTSKFDTPAIEWVFNDINKYEGLLYTTIMPSTCNLNIKFMEDKYEDLSTNPFIMLSAQTIKYINKPYYEYYIRSNSIMRSSAGYSMIDVLNEVNNRLNKYIKYVNVDIEKFKYYTYSWRIEEFIFNQLYELEYDELEKFINYIYDNLYDVIVNILNSSYYLGMIDKIKSKKISTYIRERNEAILNKDLKSFLMKPGRKYKLTASIVYYG